MKPTQTKQDATARPWGIYHEQHGVQYIGNVETRKTACTVEAGDRQAANTALIVKAVNEHAALVAVADDMRKLIEFGGIKKHWTYLNNGKIEEHLAGVRGGGAK